MGQALQPVMRQPALRSLDIREAGNIFSFQTTFVFYALERFEQWLASESTRAMLSELREQSRGSIRIAREMKRSPFANSPRATRTGTAGIAGSFHSAMLNER